MTEHVERGAALPQAQAARTGGLSPLERLRRSVLARRAVVLITLAALWQAIALYASNPILLPSFTQTVAALWDAFAHEQLLNSAAASILVLLKGYSLAIALATVLVSLATVSPLLREALLVLTAMFNPLPAIALLPIAMLWFGLGEGSLVFVLVHSVLCNRHEDPRKQRSASACVSDRHPELAHGFHDGWDIGVGVA